MAVPGCSADLANVPDLTELDLPPTMKTHFPDPADLLNFTLTIAPDEGLETPVFSSSDVQHQLIQECTAAGRLFSRLRSTTTTPMNRQKSSARKLYAFRSVIRSQGADGHQDISSQRRFRGQRLPEHSPRRLEASAESDLGDGRTTVSIPGAKCG
jgi:hypothetical protein